MYVYSKNIKDYPVIQYLFYLQFILIKTKIKNWLIKKKKNWLIKKEKSQLIFGVKRKLLYTDEMVGKPNIIIW